MKFLLEVHRTIIIYLPETLTGRHRIERCTHKWFYYRIWKHAKKNGV